MLNESENQKHGLLARIRRAFIYDTDPNNSSSIMENHIVAIFNGFYVTLILILLLACGIIYLAWRHHIAQH